jgi:GT2 family glycosyltransferase
MNAPSVSVGLPVYNGERYLRVAIESVLSQTLRDWELIICDNASTDGTQNDCGGQIQGHDDDFSWSGKKAEISAGDHRHGIDSP